MTVENGKVVSFHYTLTNAAGEVLDKSQEHPMPYLHGAGNIIPGLEKELAGKVAGDKLTVNVPAAEAYGEYHEQLVNEVPREAFQGVDVIEPGMQFQAGTPEGVQIITVKAVEGDLVIVDANHPLAGEDLTFEVEIVEVREATEEETAHGHVHGVGGHHH
ncbi:MULTISPECIES: FKBP-type peptidyl-prolyl cis-trans isomerase [Vitreoscilla]|uniref:Peptidyl-prolyl cis-trans isomerase n=1 Tax=Vitreoscilla stercoraria TaxID=61 RepID=A0ABY4E908_VITST|nr:MULTISPECIES: peptidylprolyl isomerase [Vitreoscilla]AUZ04461.1 FKBP-type peptidyl-prolyl cis-trans isomerase [Vitreoscilla sp. C1]UOO91828.1 peptidylprolyl isomerase [Vitreoscilla stercoraria]